MSDVVNSIPLEDVDRYVQRLNEFFDVQEARLLFEGDSNVDTTSGLSLRVEADADPTWCADVETETDSDFATESWEIFAHQLLPEVPNENKGIELSAKNLDALPFMKAVSLSWYKEDDDGVADDEIAASITNVFGTACTPEDMLLYSTTSPETKLLFGCLRKILFERPDTLGDQSRLTKEMEALVSAHPETIRRSCSRLIVEKAGVEFDAARFVGIDDAGTIRSALAVCVTDEFKDYAAGAVFADGQVVFMYQEAFSAQANSMSNEHTKDAVDSAIGHASVRFVATSDMTAFGKLTQYIDKHLPQD